MAKLTKEERAAKRAQEFAEDRAKLEAQLQQTIELVTAMFWELECGEALSDEQVAAAWDDRVLGFGGDMHFAEWRALAALGRTDIVDRLLTLFRQYATAQGGTDCEECGARLLPDDEDQLCVRCHGARW